MFRFRAFAAALAVLVPIALVAGPQKQGDQTDWKQFMYMLPPVEQVAQLADAREEQGAAKPRPDGTEDVTQKTARKDRKARRPRIDLALLLDTSNSMDGLINQAKSQLWKVVNDLATARKKGRTPRLRVALYEYGNQGLPSDGGYVRQVLPLTDDLDKVSEMLFALSTNGGDEYCGRVIEAATQGLTWSRNDGDLKLIVIAGNEPFTQGPVDYKQACGEAAARGIVINTIFCGTRGEGIATGWADGAKRADGTYSNIDQNQQIAEIPTPFDDELGRLSGEVNRTYYFFGRVELREDLSSNQAAQDANAFGLGAGIAADRAATKASGGYRFKNDLVDAFTKNEAILDELEAAELPDELKGKSAAEQAEFLKKKSAERDKIQKRIRELTDQRNAYIASERKKQATAGDKSQSLDEALIGALREQAEKKAFEFK